MPRLFHRVVCRALRVRIVVRHPATWTGPVLYVCNHVSWLDIFVLGSQLPAAFVAKSEVRRWPLVGWLSQLQPTLFVTRDDIHGARSQARALADMLVRHGRVILFAEGTSTDGSHVLPFKSALFDGLGQLPDLQIQPITLAYTALSGQPLTATNRDRVAWYGDMTLPPHLFRLAGERRIDVALDFHMAFPAAAEPDRKALARRCEAIVRAGHARRVEAASMAEDHALSAPGAVT